MKKLLVYITVAAVALTGVLMMPAQADAAVGYNKIGRVGTAAKTVRIGNEFELEVKKGSKVKDSNLKWYINNTKIVKFDDDDRTDEEIELRAVKAGTTKVYCKNNLTGGRITYTITVKKATNKISIVGSKNRTYNTGAEFELAVKLGGKINENKVKWTIGNTAIVGYDDDDRYDNEMEFYAKKAGTTKITAKNLLTGGSIIYNVTVKGPGPYNLVKVGNLTKTVEVGDDLDVKVSKGASLRADQINWTVGDPSILGFENGDTVGTEVEVVGLQEGTTKLYANNAHTGKYLVYTIKVVPDYDD